MHRWARRRRHRTLPASTHPPHPHRSPSTAAPLSQKHLLDQARAEAAGDGDGNAGWGGAEARSTLLLAEALQRLAREVDTERRGTAECLDHMQRAEQQQGEQIQRLAREV